WQADSLRGECAQIPGAIPTRIPAHPGILQKAEGSELLEPMQAQIKLGSGERMALGGFSVVDRARLKTLSGNVLTQLVQSDELELIYAHLVSMRNFATVRDRLAEAQPVHSAAGGPLPH